MRKYNLKIVPHILQFKQAVGTSRGVYDTHKVWYVMLSSTTNYARYGMGECAPLHDLSCDYSENYEQQLRTFATEVAKTGVLNTEALRPYPSILFGLETALQQYKYKDNNYMLWNTAFSRGEKGITINGLIWMSDVASMKQQIKDKIAKGYRCIKLKIGAIDWEEELELLKWIRHHYSTHDLELRVDANGAFSTDDVLEKLKSLVPFHLHSIEQPIAPGKWNDMAALCRQTPIAIALDEEMIGIHTIALKQELLETIQPHYIILKPTLHGGIQGCNEWISIAQSLNIGWWITSALESNVGLNAVAQYCATLNNPLPQGLGTGDLYTNNIDLPLCIEKDSLWLNKDGGLPIINDFI